MNERTVAMAERIVQWVRANDDASTARLVDGVARSLEEHAPRQISKGSSHAERDNRKGVEP